MIPPRAIVITGLFLAPLASPAGTPELEEIQVTATRLRAPAPGPVHQIVALDAAALQQHRDLAPALATLPGVHVQRAGSRSGFGAVFIEGADPNFTTVMIEGVALDNPANTRGGAADVSTLGTHGLDRVEVASGPFSSIHGSGALAGAVNLVFAGAGPDFAADARIGAGDRRDHFLAASLRGPLAGGFGAALHAELVDDGRTAGGSGFSSEAVTVKLTPLDASLGIPGTAVLRTRRSRSSGFPDASGGDLFAVLRELEWRESRQSLAAVDLPLTLAPGLHLDVRASWLEDDGRTTTPGVAPSTFDPFGLPPGRDHTRYRRSGLQALARFDHVLGGAVFGASQQWESATSEGLLDFGGFMVPNSFAMGRQTRSAFAEAQGVSGPWRANASTRLDKVEGLASRQTAGVGVAREIPRLGLDLRLSYGTAFKAPSLYALGNTLVGNPGLRPESARSWRMGLQWSDRNDLSATLSLFRSRYKDLIDFVPGPPPRLENRKAVNSQGAILQVAKSFSPELTAAAFLDATRTIDAGSGEPLLDRPRRRMGGSLQWHATPQWQFDLQHVHTGSLRSFSVPTGPVRLAQQQSLNLGANWKPAGRYNVTFAVDNLLDNRKQAVAGFSPPGRHLQVVVAGAM